jgi:hypothetical protein
MSKRFDRPAKHHIVSIHKFASGKAAFNQKKREDEERKRNEKSKTLREYAKICKAEGIVSDRVNLELYEGRNAANQKDKGSKVKISTFAPRETNPYKSASLEATVKADERAKAIEQSKLKDAEIKLKNDRREVMKRQRMKRTKKGQPILSTQIASILGKLQKGS